MRTYQQACIANCWNGERLKKSQWILGLVVLAALAALVLWARSRIHFDFHVFGAQVRSPTGARLPSLSPASTWLICFRAVRWSLLMRHNKKVPLFSLLGTQVIGFTAVALIGRVADPVRPYLVAKKTGEPLGSQIAVYIVERLFDFGCYGAHRLFGHSAGAHGASAAP